MSVHIEWDLAASCGVEVMTAERGVEELQPDAGITSGSHVLVLGGAGGGQLAIEGDLDQLAQLIARIGLALDTAHTTRPGITTSADNLEVPGPAPRDITA